MEPSGRPSVSPARIIDEVCRRLVESSPDACFIHADGRIAFANAGALALLGATRSDQVLGRDAVEFVLPAQRDAARTGIDRLAKLGIVPEPRWTLVRLDGAVVEVEVSATAFPLAGRPAVGWFVRDVTARVGAERQRERTADDDRAARTSAEEAVRRLVAIQKVTDAALAHLTLQAMLREILARVREVLGVDSATILLTTEDGTALTVHASDGLPTEPNAVIPGGQGVAGRIAATLAPVAVDDITTTEGLRAVTKEFIRSLLGTPLIVEGRAIGMLKVGSAERRHFTEQETLLLQMVADRIAPAIDRARLHDAVVEGRRRLEALSQRLLVVQELERRHVARELHDQVGQLLTSLKLRIDTGGEQLHGKETQEIVGDLLTRVRDLSMSLMPSMLEDLGLLPALMWHTDRFAAQTRVRVSFRHAGLDRRFPREIELAAFRVAQEALTNVARHTSVEQVRLDVWASAENLGVRVEDDGPGFDPDAAGARPSLGLPGMRERVRLVGGQLSIESAPGEGTRLSVVLPLAAPAAQEE
jgi:PAS domain S-box-containing protein